MKSIIVVETLQPSVTDARYIRSEHSINKALESALTERRINVRPTDICKTAIITGPTFYAHCASSDEALRKYEQNLLSNFSVKLNAKGDNPEIIFTILLSYIRHEKGYFTATIPNYNYWLLHELFKEIQPMITPRRFDDSRYDYYIHKLTAVVVDWVKHDKYSRSAMPGRVYELMHVKF